MVGIFYPYCCQILQTQLFIFKMGTLSKFISVPYIEVNDIPLESCGIWLAYHTLQPKTGDSNPQNGGLAATRGRLRSPATHPQIVSNTVYFQWENKQAYHH